MKKSSLAVAALLSTISMTVALPAAYAAGANSHLAACKGCTGCKGCMGCKGCKGCMGCKGCKGCMGCKGCKGH